MAVSCNDVRPYRVRFSFHPLLSFQQDNKTSNLTFCSVPVSAYTAADAVTQVSVEHQGKIEFRVCGVDPDYTTQQTPPRLTGDAS